MTYSSKIMFLMMGLSKNLTGHLTWVPFVSLLVKISWMCSRNVLCRGFSNAYVRSKVFEFKRIRLFGTGKLFICVIWFHKLYTV